jgi:beta-lactam-binding protein with PASTA domain
MAGFLRGLMKFLRWLWPWVKRLAVGLLLLPGRIIAWLGRHREWVMTGMLMLAVMLVSAAITVRIALHVREVTVPDFAGLTLTEASDAALKTGVDLVIENKFYSTTVPTGRVLSQAPAADSQVRRGWQVRVTESLGPQQVTIPDVVGEQEHDAAMDIRRDQLDLGRLAHIEAPGDPEMVLAQTPPPNAGVDQPRVSLLLSDNGAGGGAASAFVLPSFVGMSYAGANHAAIELGLRVAAIGGTPPPRPEMFVGGVAVAMPVVPATPEGPVTGQSPQGGFRASKGDAVRLYFGSAGQR